MKVYLKERYDGEIQAGPGKPLIVETEIEGDSKRFSVTCHEEQAVILFSIGMIDGDVSPDISDTDSLGVKVKLVDQPEPVAPQEEGGGEPGDPVSVLKGVSKGKTVVENLNAASVMTVGQLLENSFDDLVKIKGIGRATAAKLLKAANAYLNRT